MRLYTKLLATLLSVFLVTVIAFPAYSGVCVTGTSVATLETSGPFAGFWKYTLQLNWQTPKGLSHITIDCGFGLCAELACGQTYQFESPAGESSGEPECTVLYDGQFNCDGDPSIDFEDPVIKFDVADGQECEPSKNGSGTFVYYANVGPHHDAELPVVLIKNGRNVCDGVVSGDCPGVCPGGIPSIQASLNVTGDGGEVEFVPGVYKGESNKNIDLGGKNITIKSQQGAEATVIDCEGQGRAFKLNGNEPSTAVIEGFTIINGDPNLPGGALSVGPQGSNATIKGCKFQNNSSAAAFTGVVTVEGGSPTFEDCTWDGNSSSNKSSALWTKNGSPIIKDSFFMNNDTEEATVVVESGSPQFMNTAVVGNTAPSEAVFVASSAMFDQMTISQNSSDGIRFASNAPPATMMNSDVSNNSGTGIVVDVNSSSFSNLTVSGNGEGGIVHNKLVSQGYGPLAVSSRKPLESSSSSPTFSDLVVSGNINTTSSGGGIRFDCTNSPVGTYAPTYINCTITGNASALDGGGVAICGNAIFGDITPIFSSCTIAVNSAGGLGGGIHTGVTVGGASTSVTLDQTIVYNNCAVSAGDEAFADANNTLAFSCSDVDASGTGGTGSITFDTDVTFDDPAFCAPPDCDPTGTTSGDFTLLGSSAASPSNNPCGLLIGANPVACVATGIEDGPEVPRMTSLFPATPNPFNPTTTVRFDLSEATHVTLRVYDALGRYVRTLADEYLTAAQHEYLWNGMDDRGNAVATGVYFVRLQAGDVLESQKMVLLK